MSRKVEPLSDEQIGFLNLRRLPARLTEDQAALLLGFPAHIMPLLAAKDIIKPLGRPARNCQKWYATHQVLKLCDNVKELDKASRLVMVKWSTKNSKSKKEPTETDEFLNDIPEEELEPSTA
jgi:hypothetical protein